MRNVLIAAILILNAECNIACLDRGFDKGYYKNKNCECVTIVDYEMACRKYKPKIVTLEQNGVSEYSRGEY